MKMLETIHILPVRAESAAPAPLRGKKLDQRAVLQVVRKVDWKKVGLIAGGVTVVCAAAGTASRYKFYQGKGLFPFTSQQQYNQDIKTMFRLSGLTRIVTVINPTTREEEQRPICDIASSHMARRSFVGNLYKKVKDPNLIGKLSGHKEGSKAFVRYREIDKETSQETINLLEEE